MRFPNFYYTAATGWVRTCSECLRKRKEKRKRIALVKRVLKSVKEGDEKTQYEWAKNAGEKRNTSDAEITDDGMDSSAQGTKKVCLEANVITDLPRRVEVRVSDGSPTQDSYAKYTNTHSENRMQVKKGGSDSADAISPRLCNGNVRVEVQHAKASSASSSPIPTATVQSASPPHPQTFQPSTIYYPFQVCAH